MRSENFELQRRLNEFVRGSIDNLLATRLHKDREAGMEGELITLDAAKSQLSIKLAGSEIRLAQLQREMEGHRLQVGFFVCGGVRVQSCA